MTPAAKQFGETRGELQPRPLEGVRVIELAGIGPVPFCGMMLADAGAEVIRIDRPGGSDPLGQDDRRDILLRSRRTITLDLKRADSIEIVKRLVAGADGFLEGFRPGVAERLGLGPEDLCAINPALVYGRMTGYGQSGPLADRAGHDLNYIALSGTLSAIGPQGEPPLPPLNLIGDYGGGGMMLAFGVLAALLAARETGIGRTIDCSMVEGAATLASAMWSLRHNGQWDDERGSNLLDGGAPFYAAYACADGRFVAIGAIEAKFYASLIEGLGLAADPLFANQHDRARWPAMKARLGAIFAGHPSAHWSALLADRDCCFSEVIDLADAPAHPHNRSRGTFTEVEGLIQPAPAPRFENTEPGETWMWMRDADRDAILEEIGWQLESSG